jgi:hypothetical protein
VGNSSFGRIRRTLPIEPSLVRGTPKTKLHDLLKLGGIVSVAPISMPKVQMYMAEGPNREVQDAERAPKFDANYLNGVYAPEVENDWAFEFQLTGGGS